MKVVMRKLFALKYPDYDNLDINDDASFRKLIIWLEDQTIRHYAIVDRNNLRDVRNKNWDKSFTKYLKDLGCPFEQNNRQVVVDWLCAVAVKLAYNDNAAKNASCRGSTVKGQREIVKSLKNLRVEDAEVQAGIGKLSKMLELPNHPDHMLMLQAVSIFVQERIATYNNCGDKSSASSGSTIRVPLAKQALGFETGDEQVDQAARALRLLHIDELRRLQTCINQAIVSVQSLTANPKTDQRLGKVGRS